jgi:hypothetical protein
MSAEQVSPYTVNKRIRSVKSFLTWTFSEEYISKDLSKQFKKIKHGGFTHAHSGYVLYILSKDFQIKFFAIRYSYSITVLPWRGL